MKLQTALKFQQSGGKSRGKLQASKIFYNFKSDAMTDDIEPPETATLLKEARSSNFNTVTTAGNKCVTALKEIVNESPQIIVKKIRAVMPDLLQTTVSVAFEKAKLWSVIESDPNLSYFRDLDYDSWMNPGDLNKSELEKAKVRCLKQFILSTSHFFS